MISRVKVFNPDGSVKHIYGTVSMANRSKKIWAERSKKRGHSDAVRTFAKGGDKDKRKCTVCGKPARDNVCGGICSSVLHNQMRAMNEKIPNS